MNYKTLFKLYLSTCIFLQNLIVAYKLATSAGVGGVCILFACSGQRAARAGSAEAAARRTRRGRLRANGSSACAGQRRRAAATAWQPELPASPPLELAPPRRRQPRACPTTTTHPRLDRHATPHDKQPQKILQN